MSSFFGNTVFNSWSLLFVIEVNNFDVTSVLDITFTTTYIDHI